MMGQQGAAQERLFRAFSLESHVPADHLLRRIDGALDLSDLRRHLAPYYSHTGRPSIDRELMIRMLIVGYCPGVRSERRLCEEVHLNLSCRHSGAFRWLFEEPLRRCMAAGLVQGEGFAVDARVADRSARALDVRAGRTRLLRLLDELPGRRRARRHRRCRGDVLAEA